jgi:DNA-binding CsgD family transcriptional regulator
MWRVTRPVDRMAGRSHTPSQLRGGLLNLGEIFNGKLDVAPAVGASNVVGVDFNRDGIVDLALITPDAELIVLLSAEERLYRQSFRCRLDIQAQGLYAADLDGDGTLDLAVAHTGGRGFSVLHGHGDGTFSPPSSPVASKSPTWSLTSRELEVARLAAGGYTCTEIADKLGISRRTAETHVGAIRSKLELKHKRELVNLAKPPVWWRLGGLIPGALSGPTAASGSAIDADVGQLGFGLAVSALALLIGLLLGAIQRPGFWRRADGAGWWPLVSLGCGVQIRPRVLGPAVARVPGVALVLFFIHVAGRRNLWAACTGEPNGEWVTQPARNVLWQLADEATESRPRSGGLTHEYSRQFEVA